MKYRALKLVSPTAGAVRKNRPLQLIEALVGQGAPLIRGQRRQIRGRTVETGAPGPERAPDAAPRA